MKSFTKIAMAMALSLTLIGCGAQEDGKTKIGIIQLAEHPALDQSREGFLAALEEAGYTEDTTNIDYKNANNDLSNCESIADLFVNDNKSLIYAIATPAAQSVANKTSTIPLVVSAVTDPADSGLVDSNERPGNNVTGASDLTPVKEQIQLLTQLVPSAKKVAILYCSSEDNSIFQADLAKEACKEANLEPVETTVSDSNMIQQVVESLIGKVDAIYIPTDNLLAEGMTTVSAIANENKLPVIVGEKGMVDNGGLATYGIDYYELGKLAGKQAISILKGESEPADMPIETLPLKQCQLAINQETASALGITIPSDLLETAEVVGS